MRPACRPTPEPVAVHLAGGEALPVHGAVGQGPDYTVRRRRLNAAGVRFRTSWHRRWPDPTSDRGGLAGKRCNDWTAGLARLLLNEAMDREIPPRDKRRLTIRRALIVVGWLLAFVLAVLALRAIISPGVAREDLRLARVERGSVVATISATGEVVPHNEQVISARLNSEVLEVAARAGDSVREGQVLLRLDASTIETSIRELREQLSLKENERKSTRLELERSLNESQGRYELLEIDLEGARAKHERLAALVDRGAISRGDLQEAELEVRRREVELAQLERTIANQKATTDAELERIDLEAAILRNQLEEQQRLLASATVRSPRDGIVTWLLDETGTAVAPGAALARVADLSSYRVEMQISDFYADRLRDGLETRVDTGAAVLDGTVVGYTVLEHSFFERGFITMLMVGPAQRRRGVGAALVRHVPMVVRDEVRPIEAEIVDRREHILNEFDHVEGLRSGEAQHRHRRAVGYPDRVVRRVPNNSAIRRTASARSAPAPLSTTRSHPHERPSVRPCISATMASGTSTWRVGSRPRMRSRQIASPAVTRTSRTW